MPQSRSLQPYARMQCTIWGRNVLHCNSNAEETCTQYTKSLYDLYNRNHYAASRKVAGSSPDEVDFLKLT
jgi:hypothetical protein